MSNNSEIKNTVNETINSVGNNSDVNKYKQMALEQKEKLDVFMGEHGGKVFGLLIILFILFIYFFYIFRRVSRSVNRMDRTIKKFSNIIPLEHSYPCTFLSEEAVTDEYLEAIEIDYEEKKGIDHYVLADFYVNCSYKSYLPCTNYFDYSSLKIIEKIIKNGVRFIDIDVMNMDFNSCTEPVVCYGKERGNWQYTTRETFRNVINSISLLAFSHHVTNMSDPFFIHINFKTWYNDLTKNKCAEIIKSFLGPRLLESKYSYQGRLSKTNIGTEKMNEFLGKCIIVSSSNVENTDMDELVNIGIKDNFRCKTFENIKDVADPKELIEFNKKHFTMGYPPVETRNKQNQNFWTAYYFGCQFLCMNYTESDQWMISYLDHFKNSSFILKPYKLRYKPLYVDKPKKQNRENSFAPKTVTSPTYQITY